MLGMPLVAKRQHKAVIICFRDIYLPPLCAIIVIYVTRMFYFLRASTGVTIRFLHFFWIIHEMAFFEPLLSDP